MTAGPEDPPRPQFRRARDLAGISDVAHNPRNALLCRRPRRLARRRPAATLEPRRVATARFQMTASDSASSTRVLTAAAATPLSVAGRRICVQSRGKLSSSVDGGNLTGTLRRTAASARRALRRQRRTQAAFAEDRSSAAVHDVRAHNASAACRYSVAQLPTDCEAIKNCVLTSVCISASSKLLRLLVCGSSHKSRVSPPSCGMRESSAQAGGGPTRIAFPVHSTTTTALRLRLCGSESIGAGGGPARDPSQPNGIKRGWTGPHEGPRRRRRSRR